jgi:dTMP kinase
MTHLAMPAAAPGAHGEPGVLLVLEGIDRSGRSTHARRLEEHLRYTGRGVARTSLTSSLLAADRIRRAKRDGHAGPSETALLYAADLTERVEQVVLPSLRAGLVVIADRYCWTPMARAEVRGVPAAWLTALFSFVPPPDAVFFLDVDAATSLTRQTGDPDPYEAGLDLGLSADVRESYRLFQERLAALFESYAGPSRFTRLAGAGAPDDVGPQLIAAADAVLATRAMKATTTPTSSAGGARP